MKGPNFSPQLEKSMLATLAECGREQRAAELHGVKWQTWRKWKTQHHAFRDAVKRTVDEFHANIAAMAGEAVRRELESVLAGEKNLPPRALSEGLAHYIAGWGVQRQDVSVTDATREFIEEARKRGEGAG